MNGSALTAICGLESRIMTMKYGLRTVHTVTSMYVSTLTEVLQ
jgi:hypothetical protein